MLQLHSNFILEYNIKSDSFYAQKKFQQATFES